MVEIAFLMGSMQLFEFFRLYHTEKLISWGCRIHRLHFYWGVRPHPQQVSSKWHETVWWGAFSDSGALGNAEYPFTAIAPEPTLVWFVEIC